MMHLINLWTYTPSNVRHLYVNTHQRVNLTDRQDRQTEPMCGPTMCSTGLRSLYRQQ